MSKEYAIEQIRKQRFFDLKTLVISSNNMPKGFTYNEYNMYTGESFDSLPKDGELVITFSGAVIYNPSKR